MEKENTNLVMWRLEWEQEDLSRGSLCPCPQPLAIDVFQSLFFAFNLSYFCPTFIFYLNNCILKLKNVFKYLYLLNAFIYILLILKPL
jgi:hypothetical protein